MTTFIASITAIASRLTTAAVMLTLLGIPSPSQSFVEEPNACESSYCCEGPSPSGGGPKTTDCVPGTDCAGDIYSCLGCTAIPRDGDCTGGDACCD